MKKIGLKSLGIIAAFAFSIALTSCGGSSGGGDKEIEFEVKDLVNKYWYYNGFVNSSYDASGVLLVYKFQGNSYDTKGKLVKQQFSGRIDDETVGTWELLDNKLTIVDKTIAGSPTQEWYLREDASATNLKLRGAGDLGGDREFYSEISGLDDVTADAFYTRVKNSDGSVNNYISYEVTGQYLKRVVAMLNNDLGYELKRFEEVIKKNGAKFKKVVFRLDDEKVIDYLEEFKGQEIKFYIELEDGTKLMLNESLSTIKIDPLAYIRGYSPDEHVVSWNSNLGDGIYYKVEVLDGNKKVVFRSVRQPVNYEGDLNLLTVVNEMFDPLQLKTEDDISIRIIAFKYEEGINATNFFYKNSNIQVKSEYTYKNVW